MANLACDGSGREISNLLGDRVRLYLTVCQWWRPRKTDKSKLKAAQAEAALCERCRTAGKCLTSPVSTIYTVYASPSIQSVVCATQMSGTYNPLAAGGDIEADVHVENKVEVAHYISLLTFSLCRLNVGLASQTVGIIVFNFPSY